MKGIIPRAASSGPAPGYPQGASLPYHGLLASLAGQEWCSEGERMLHLTTCLLSPCRRTTRYSVQYNHRSVLYSATPPRYRNSVRPSL